MLTVSFKLAVYQYGQLVQLYDDHEVEFPGVPQLLKAMITLGARSSRVQHQVPVTEVLERSMTFPLPRINGGIGPDTCIVICDARVVKDTSSRLETDPSQDGELPGEMHAAVSKHRQVDSQQLN